MTKQAVIAESDYTNLDKFKGCLIGLAIGDVLGIPFEFWKGKEVVEYLFNNKLEINNFIRGSLSFPAGFYSDDTSMMICLVESLIEKGFDLEDQYERYKNWYSNGYATPLGERCYGIGQQTLKSLQLKPNFDNLNGYDIKAGGNGSLMRCAPIGLRYRGKYNLIKEYSLLSSYITHNYFISGWTCVVLNSIISLIIDGLNKKEILKEIIKIHRLEIPEEIINILKIDYSAMENYDYQISGYSVDTLRIAIWSWMSSDNYLSSIEKVIKLGNDTDTFAAVTGAITGCYYGYKNIPHEYSSKVIRGEYILKLSEDLLNKPV